jgi:hypothetical protein
MVQKHGDRRVTFFSLVILRPIPTDGVGKGNSPLINQEMQTQSRRRFGTGVHNTQGVGRPGLLTIPVNIPPGKINQNLIALDQRQTRAQFSTIGKIFNKYREQRFKLGRAPA